MKYIKYLPSSYNPILFILIVSLIFLDSELIYSSPNKINIIFRIDDYGIDNADIYKDIFMIFNSNNIPLTVGVVPFNFVNNTLVNIDSSKTAFLNKYLLTNKIEIAQHGYSHFNNYKSKSASEFYNMNYAKQVYEISSGKLLLEKAFNTKIITFIPPWNTYDSNTVNILDSLGFKYLSAATYGNIQVIQSKINYVPYTVLLSDMEHIKSTIQQITSKEEGKTYLIVILMHTYDYMDSHIHTSTHNLSINESNLISFTELRHFLSWLIKHKNISFSTFSNLSKLNFGRNRLDNNTYFDDIIPVLWITNFSNTYYLEENECNLNKYLRILYQFLFYPLLFVISMVLIRILTGVISIRRKFITIIPYFSLALAALIIIAILSLNLFLPRYLVLITLLISISYSFFTKNKRLGLTIK